jgi:hypothetical protein
MTRQGVHRRALARAVRAAWWIDADQDAAAVRAAGDLADMLDLMRANRPTTLAGLVVLDTKEAWHAASVHAKFQTALESLRLTPATRPETVTEDTADLISDLRRSLQDL